MVDMSSAAVTARLRLMGELCDKMLNDKNVAEESASAELDAEIVESDEDAIQNRER
jgi:hypothetical protein